MPWASDHHVDGVVKGAFGLRPAVGNPLGVCVWVCDHVAGGGVCWGVCYGGGG